MEYKVFHRNIFSATFFVGNIKKNCTFNTNKLKIRIMILQQLISFIVALKLKAIKLSLLIFF